tara:strand:+ start:570 stop:917 length:348 start_codon:yes stop_codon:yes gene_type:complete
MSGFYEFPGGKVEKDEFFIEALYREVLEELNIEIDISKVFFLKSYKKNLKRGKLNLIFFECDRWIGKIKNNENQKILWVCPSKIRNFNMLESNKDFVKYLMFYYFSIHKLKQHRN